MPRPEPPRVPERPARTVRLVTRWSEADVHGVLNNATYLTLLEEARLAYFRELDLMDGERFPFVLGQTTVRFLAPGRGAAEVLVEVTTTELGVSSFRQAYRVRDAADGAVWVEAEATLVAVDRAGRSRPLDEAFRARVQALERSRPA